MKDAEFIERAYRLINVLNPSPDDFEFAQTQLDLMRASRGGSVGLLQLTDRLRAVMGLME